MKNYKNIWYILSSIFFALVLFQNNANIRLNKSETYTNTITNVPIDVKYDSDEYFISGFSSEATVSLTGSNRLTLASEMQESTRKFKIVADLTNVKTGISEVKLSINNLPSGLTATVNPDKITVKVPSVISPYETTVKITTKTSGSSSTSTSSTSTSSSNH